MLLVFSGKMFSGMLIVIEINDCLTGDAEVEERRRRGTPVRAFAVVTADLQDAVRHEGCAAEDADGG